MIGTLANGMIVLMMAKFMLNDLPHALEYGEKRAELVRQYGKWSVGRAESVCPYQDLGCIESEAARLQTTVLRR